MNSLLIISNLLIFLGWWLLVRSNRRLRRENKSLTETVTLQQRQIESERAAVEFADTAGLILANQGEWPEYLETK